MVQTIIIIINYEFDSISSLSSLFHRLYLSIRTYSQLMPKPVEQGFEKGRIPVQRVILWSEV